ncbi:Transcription initiation factor TFIID subunit 12 [Chytridiales sp. JEL 0842]|nr:Transcription initiation factor TFIID subunit 12 [Chytridiales sp. JEL 0842]
MNPNESFFGLTLPPSAINQPQTNPEVNLALQSSNSNQQGSGPAASNPASAAKSKSARGRGRPTNKPAGASPTLPATQPTLPHAQSASNLAFNPHASPSPLPTNINPNIGNTTPTPNLQTLFAAGAAAANNNNALSAANVAAVVAAAAANQQQQGGGFVGNGGINPQMQMQYLALLAANGGNNAALTAALANQANMNVNQNPNPSQNNNLLAQQLTPQQIRTLALKSQLLAASRNMGTANPNQAAQAAAILAAANQGNIRPNMMQNLTGGGLNAAAMAAAMAGQGGQLNLQQMQIIQQLRNLQTPQPGGIPMTAANAAVAANLVAAVGAASAISPAATTSAGSPINRPPGTPVGGINGMASSPPGQQLQQQQQPQPQQQQAATLNFGAWANADIPSLQKALASRHAKLVQVEEELRKPDIPDHTRLRISTVRMQIRVQVLQLEYVVRTRTGTITPEQSEQYKKQMAITQQQFLAHQQALNGGLNQTDGNVRPVLNLQGQLNLLKNHTLNSMNVQNGLNNPVSNAVPGRPMPGYPAGAAQAATSQSQLPQAFAKSVTAIAPYHSLRLFPIGTDSSTALASMPIRPPQTKRTIEDQIREIWETEAEARNGSGVVGGAKRKIQEIVGQMDPKERVDSEVEQALLEIADNFIDHVTQFACQMAKHRKSNTVEVKDFSFPLERNWNLRVPGFHSTELRLIRKGPTPSHVTRVLTVKKAQRDEQIAKARAKALELAKAAELAEAALNPPKQQQEENGGVEDKAGTSGDVEADEQKAKDAVGDGEGEKRGTVGIENSQLASPTAMDIATPPQGSPSTVEEGKPVPVDSNNTDGASFDSATTNGYVPNDEGNVDKEHESTVDPDSMEED